MISNDYITYKKLVSTPDLFVFNIARHVCDSFIYTDQLRLAHSANGFYLTYSEETGDLIEQEFYPNSEINYIYDFDRSLYFI